MKTDSQKWRTNSWLPEKNRVGSWAKWAKGVNYMFIDGN